MDIGTQTSLIIRPFDLENDNLEELTIVLSSYKQLADLV
ncbi:hypothetical protein HNR44_003166 [Geomicrobium halophilum]|uniref:Uncharacterized protein n=1 Tax=Geomicrobium halophilum TaxID=549000 RepID=A0A841Q0N3_9BACL|nr:hypothetical protein [Geomicrobium halophilum]